MQNVSPPDVVGGTELLAKQSAVNDRGELKRVPIEGVQFRPTRPVPHEDGYVTEISRASWDILAAPIAQTHMTTTFPGRTRAWELHRLTTDRLFVVTGLLKIAIYDGRTGSPTKGTINEFIVSDKNPGLIVVPPNLYHGWKNIGVHEAIILNMPDRMYEYDQPDALKLAWDGAEAQRIIPYVW